MRLKNKRSIPLATARFGSLLIIVDHSIPGFPNDHFIVSGNGPLPDEIIAAATFWAKNNYADLSLSEYLHRMFNSIDYEGDVL